MGWKEKSARYYFYDSDEILLAQHIIDEAYDEGFIDWDMYREAMGRIRSNLKGIWMIEQEIPEPVIYTKKYMTDKMGEVTVKGFEDFGILTEICGNYNSKEISIANTGFFVSFNDNFDYIMKVINQYKEIHELSKKAIIDNFNNNEYIREFFYHYYSLEEEISEALNFTASDEREFIRVLHRLLDDKKNGKEKAFKMLFDINNAVEKLKYPFLYFDFGRNEKGERGIYFAVQYRMHDVSGVSEPVLEVFMDDDLNINGFELI